MKCESFNNELVNSGDAEKLSAEALKHIEKCSSCKYQVEMDRAVKGYINEQKSRKLPSYIKSNIITSIERESVNYFNIFMPALRVASLLVLFFTGYYTAGYMAQERSDVGDEQIVYYDYFTTKDSGFSFESIWFQD
ncbi:hypothetical protein QA597_03545 [Marinilabiliaceae bacterium ANBcel2]|nr:hypothetical protein [Marinilabiliaceae bacterium ANBcel2]